MASYSIALDKLQSGATNLSFLGLLSDAQRNKATAARNILNNVQTSKSRNKYKLFLISLLQESGPAAVIVCAVFVGIKIVAALSHRDEARLREHIKASSAISHPIIIELAATNQITNETKRTNHTNRTTFNRTDHASKLQIPGALHTNLEEPRVATCASIEGTKEVFGNICDAIRPVYAMGHWRAAVTTAMPKWGGVKCAMSLEIRDESYHQLASALFNTSVTREKNTFSIAIPDGPNLIATPDRPTSGSGAELTLIGAKESAITEVFSPTVCNAIERVLVDDQQLVRAESVSMTFAKTGTIINLSLHLEGGLELVKKLYYWSD